MRLTTVLRVEGLAGRAGGRELDEEDELEDELDEEDGLDVGRVEELEDV